MTVGAYPFFLSRYSKANEERVSSAFVDFINEGIHPVLLDEAVIGADNLCVGIFFEKLLTGKLNLKKIVTNVNIIAIVIGALLMVTGIKLPQFALDITSSFGSMLGNIGMVIAGMMAAQVDYKKMLLKKRLYLVLALRMLIYPIITLAAVKLVGGFSTLPNAEGVLLVSFLASITPSAATVMQLAKLHNTEPDYSVAINIVTTLVCVGTMPLFVYLYFL